MLGDLIYAWRMLRKAPGFALVAVLSLALGTDANSAMFSFVDALILRPLPVARGAEVLTLDGKGQAPINPVRSLSYREYLDFRESCKTLTDFAAASIFRLAFSAPSDAPAKVKYGSIVSGDVFQTMGVRPALGRVFRKEEDEVPGRDAVVVLGYDFWQDEFGGDPKIIGRVVRINGTDFTVIGVAAEQFTGLDPYLKSALFLPAMMIPRLSTGSLGPFDMLEDRDYRAFIVKARRKPGVTLAQGQAEVTSIARGLAQAYPASNQDRTVLLRTEMQRRIETGPREAGLMAMLMLMAVLVLVVSCFNVANLLLSRAQSRVKEVAVRMAMGAGRARLIRQLLTESLLLAAAGAVVGLWFAWVVLIYLRGFKIPSDLPFMFDFHLNQRVLLFSSAAALLSVVLFGLAPALQSSKVDLVPALKAAGGGSGRRRLWGRKLLVVGQVAISLILLVVSVMLYRGFRRQLFAGVGFRTSHLMMMSFDPGLVRYTDQQAGEFYRRLEERAALAPGVKSVATTNVVPLSIMQRGFTLNVVPEGYQLPPGQESLAVLTANVGAGYFETMEVPIVAGRAFRSTDKDGAPKVAVVNEAFARKYWLDAQRAVGKRIRLDDGQKSWVQVIGVARTGPYSLLTEPPTDFVYLPMLQHPGRYRTLLAASHGESASLAAPLREVVRSLDPKVPILDMRTMEDYFETGVVSQFNTILNMVGAMGLMGLTLAMVGLYGLVGYSVSCRTREFGIRMAIGADRRSVLLMVLRQGGALAAAGIAIGVGASWPARDLLKVIVHGADSDSMPHVAVALLLLAVTLLASYGPARRASRVDPVKALRDE
jgi:predicted permease